MHYLWSQESVAESPSPALCDRSQFQMISFSLDPQWCGLLFSVYFRHEKPGLIGPDAFAACSLAGPQWDADWIAFAGSFGFEICRISTTWAVIFDTVKTSGVILLLGVGSFVCYKLYHYYWPRSRSRLNSPNSSPPHTRHSDGCLSLHRTDDNQLVEDIDEEDISNIEAQYFGPNLVPSENKGTGNFNAAKIFEKNKRSLEQDVSSSPEFQNGSSGEEESFDVNASDNYRKRKLHYLLQQRTNCPRSQDQYLLQSWESLDSAGNSPNWLVKRLGNVLTPPPREQQFLHCGSVSLPVTPGRLLKNGTNNCNRRRKLLDHSEVWKHSNLAAEEEEKIIQALKSLNQCVSQARFNSSDESVGRGNTNLWRDESFDSLGLSKTIAREASFDSSCSEMSLDFSLPEATVATNTMMHLERLQQEIDQLKDNCLMMDEDFETIKCNRNLPGMSSLMKVTSDSTHPSDSADAINHNIVSETIKEEHARACFAGLYSLTTIKHSTSSELSDSFAGNGQGSLGSAESLQWDSPKPEGSPAKCVNLGSTEILNNYVLESNLVPAGLHSEFLAETDNNSSPATPCEDDLMASLEWDEVELLGCSAEDLEIKRATLQVETECEFSPQNALQMVSLEEEKVTNTDICTLSSYTERSSEMESSGIECSMTNSATTMASSMLSNNCDQKVCPSFSWSSEESGYMDWDRGSVKQSTWPPQAQQGWSDISALVKNDRSHSSVSSHCSVSASELSTPVGENLSQMASPCSEPALSMMVTVENIGHKQSITEYAAREWRGKTQKAERILKGYGEIPSKLGVKHLRKIRGDNYCGVRASIFQTLAQGFPIPNGTHTFKCLCHALHEEGCSWLEDWTFAGRLPYQNSNVLHGMENCLRSLDNVASLLLSSNDRGEALAAILNSDQLLDLHVVEAVKLHMLVSAWKLYKANTSGADIPLFAMLMFARDTSETPQDLMNNHLQEVGNAGGLEQIEMYLLGYTLGVTLQVVRPSAYGTEDFVCFYPDWNVGMQPQVLLVAEDDRHYNVLVD